MPALIVPLPKEDLAFLQTYSSAHGTSAEAFLAQQVRNLREHLQTPLRPEVTAASGIIDPELDAAVAHHAHLEMKHS